MVFPFVNRPSVISVLGVTVQVKILCKLFIICVFVLFCMLCILPNEWNVVY